MPQRRAGVQFPTSARAVCPAPSISRSRQNQSSAFDWPASRPMQPAEPFSQPRQVKCRNKLCARRVNLDSSGQIQAHRLPDSTDWCVPQRHSR